MEENVIYFDNNSTTRLDINVLNTMMPYFTDVYANSSSNHNFGLRAKRAVEESRENIADLINADSNEIFFTSGATEGINLALKGLSTQSIKKHIITCQTEHKAVLDSCKYLEMFGYDLTYLNVDTNGDIDIHELIDAIRPDTLAICIMWINNETGIINDITKIGNIAKLNNIYFITDATQGIGKLKIDVNTSNIDILVMSAHKFYGPKGVGAIYVSSKINTGNMFKALLHGGGQEKGLRSGTLNVPGIVGLGAACELALTEMGDNSHRILDLRDALENKLQQINGCVINGRLNSRIYNTVNFYLPNFDASIFIGKNKNIAVSNGSACNSSVIEPSHVLKSMGLTDEQAFGSIRVSLSKWNTLSEILYFSELIKKSYNEQY